MEQFTHVSQKINLSGAQKIKNNVMLLTGSFRQILKTNIILFRLNCLLISQNNSNNIEKLLLNPLELDLTLFHVIFLKLRPLTVLMVKL